MGLLSMATTPTQRSLKHLRDQGYLCGITEHWNSFIKRRQDLFGFIDIVAISPTESGVLAIQTTSGSNVSARLNKILENEYSQAWLKAGNRIVIHGWAKRGPRGKRKVWTVRELEVKTDSYSGD